MERRILFKHKRIDDKFCNIVGEDENSKLPQQSLRPVSCHEFNSPQSHLEHHTEKISSIGGSQHEVTAERLSNELRLSVSPRRRMFSSCNRNSQSSSYSMQQCNLPKDGTAKGGDYSVRELPLLHGRSKIIANEEEQCKQVEKSDDEVLVDKYFKEHVFGINEVDRLVQEEVHCEKPSKKGKNRKNNQLVKDCAVSTDSFLVDDMQFTHDKEGKYNHEDAKNVEVPTRYIILERKENLKERRGRKERHSLAKSKQLKKRRVKPQGFDLIQLNMINGFFIIHILQCFLLQFQMRFAI